MVSLRSQDRSRTSKPAKPARRDRKPPGTRKAPASPAKPGGAASAPAAALDWNRISYEPTEIKNLRSGMAAMFHTIGEDRKCWEGVIEWFGTPINPDLPINRKRYPHPDSLSIAITLRSGEKTTIEARSSELRAWRGTFSK
ncbi:MAG: hypothetical protein IBJ18_01570 [Phycisphaerales bacterium]|nr:hypothetical protein [Phycisphaerales bacterium]